MNILSIAFLVLEILIIGLGALIGYKRGAGRSAVRVAYLAIIGIAAFFIARGIAFKTAIPIYEAIMSLISSPDLKLVFEKAPELGLLIKNITGAILAPVIFALLFFVLQLLSLICFKLASTKIVELITKKSEAPSKKSKWIGLGVGVVSAIAVAAVLLSPMYMMLSVIDNISDETIEILADTVEIDNNSVNAATSEKALKASTAAEVAIKPSFAVTKAHPISALITNGISKYEVPAASGKESVPHTLNVLIDVTGDVLYALNATTDNGGSTLEILSNSVAAVIPHLDDSLTLKDVATCAISALGEVLLENKSFMGIALPTGQNDIVDQVTNSVLKTMSATTLDSVDENMVMLFGVISNDYLPESKRNDAAVAKAGLLVTVDKLQSSDDPQAAIKQALVIFSDSPEMTAMLNDMLAEYISTSVLPDVGIDKDAIKDILDNSNIDFSTIDITNLSKDDINNMIANGDIVLNDATMDAIKNYLGNDSITKEDIDNFLNGSGNITDILGGNTSSETDDTADTGSVDIGDIDLGDIDLGDVDLDNFDINNIDINTVDISKLTPEQIDMLMEKYGHLLH